MTEFKKKRYEKPRIMSMEDLAKSLGKDCPSGSFPCSQCSPGNVTRGSCGGGSVASGTICSGGSVASGGSCGGGSVPNS